MEKEKNGRNHTSRVLSRLDLDDSGSDSNGDNCNQYDTVNGNTESEKISRALRSLFHMDSMKFMNNFDPELSNREKRKLNRKFNQEGSGRRNSLYDENGVLRSSGKDICDCLNEECPGCHFPCPKCRSCKCGFECRHLTLEMQSINRKWMYEMVENEGDKVISKNPALNH